MEYLALFLGISIVAALILKIGSRIEEVSARRVILLVRSIEKRWRFVGYELAVQNIGQAKPPGFPRKGYIAKRWAIQMNAVKRAGHEDRLNGRSLEEALENYRFSPEEEWELQKISGSIK